MVAQHSEPKPFRFLDLPPEVRLIVYEHLPIQTRHAVLERSSILAHIWPEPAHGEKATITLVTKSITAGILATCKLVQSEALPIILPRLGTLAKEPVKFILDFDAFEAFSAKNGILQSCLKWAKSRRHDDQKIGKQDQAAQAEILKLFALSPAHSTRLTAGEKLKVYPQHDPRDVHAMSRFIVEFAKYFYKSPLFILPMHCITVAISPPKCPLSDAIWTYTRNLATLSRTIQGFRYLNSKAIGIMPVGVRLPEEETCEAIRDGIDGYMGKPSKEQWREQWEATQ